MIRLGSSVALGFFAFALSLGFQRTAHALDMQSPALYARYANYSPLSQSQPGQGPSCFNVPASMPAGRQSYCSVSPLSHPSTGVYKVTVVNGAPLPTSPDWQQDTGWAVYVTPVGSNARCAETGFSQSGNDITSTITCVNANGNNVDTQFSWIYRTDSLSYPQAGSYAQDTVYARVYRGNPALTSSSQSFVSFNTYSAGPVSTQWLSTGQYRVTFQDVNQRTSWDQVEPSTGMNNVIVQRVCLNDNSANCRRAVCVPTTWSFGDVQGTNTTVDVQCSLGTTPIDVDFRVFVGPQAHNGQSDGWIGGMHFGWLNAPSFSSSTCKSTTQFLHRNQHESPYDVYPTLPLSVCRNSTGVYRVPFTDHFSFYHYDAASALSTSRTVGAYCNVSSIDCGGENCSANPAIGVRCYDNSTGNLKNSLWNLSVVY